MTHPYKILSMIDLSYTTNPCVEIMLLEPSRKEFRVEVRAVVDGQNWVTVITHTESTKWIRAQPREFWFETFDNNVINVFDISEELLLIMKLKWES